MEELGLRLQEATDPSNQTFQPLPLTIASGGLVVAKTEVYSHLHEKVYSVKTTCFLPVSLTSYGMFIGREEWRVTK